MDILKRSSGRVIKQKGSSARITIPKEIYTLMKLEHTQEVILTLTDTGQLIIEKAKENNNG